MAERPFTGEWSQTGDRVTLRAAGNDILVLAAVGGGELKPVAGPMVKGIPGSLWKMPAAWEQSLRKQTEVDATVERARAIGEAISIRSYDNGDSLPGKQQELERVLLPYLHKEGSFEGFTYTYREGKLPPRQRRAGKQIGYVLGTGGRAIVYADGDAKWQPDK